jgi:small-conductance mechanosensitive channel
VIGYTTKQAERQKERIDRAGARAVDAIEKMRALHGDDSDWSEWLDEAQDCIGQAMNSASVTIGRRTR